MHDDADRCYRVLQSKDARFDGWFVTGVLTTGIYCRPSCPAVVPKRANVRFFPTAAAAQLAGFRACKRCRPDAVPGSPEWNRRADLVGRAMRLIADGVVDRDGVAGLARRLGYSERHLHRELRAELGAGPNALARAERAQTARLLIETTDLSFTHVAFAAGFSSIRQFNDTVRAVFATTPTALRAGRRTSGAAPTGTISLRLPCRQPFAGDALLDHLAARAVPGVEHAFDDRFVRSLDLPHAPATVELRPFEDHVRATLRLGDVRDLAVAVERCRRLLDLDADPVAVDELLGADPLLGPWVAKTPGRRVPGTVDGAELAIRAVLGQQVSVAGARTVAGRLVATLGRPLDTPEGPVTHLFPRPEDLVDAVAADPDLLPMPRARRTALVALCQALATGGLGIDPGADRAATLARLERLPGIGPWTSGYIAMRALADPDAFLPSDLGVRHALRALGDPADRPTAALRRAESWRPWRAYATHHLWAALAAQPSRRSRP